MFQNQLLWNQSLKGKSTSSIRVHTVWRVYGLVSSLMYLRTYDSLCMTKKVSGMKNGSALINMECVPKPDIVVAGQPLPPCIQRYLKWNLSNITPIVVRRTVSNSGYRLVRSKFRRHLRIRLLLSVCRSFFILLSRIERMDGYLGKTHEIPAL